MVVARLPHGLKSCLPFFVCYGLSRVVVNSRSFHIESCHLNLGNVSYPHSIKLDNSTTEAKRCFGKYKLFFRKHVFRKVEKPDFLLFL